MFYTPACIEPYEKYNYQTCKNIIFSVNGVRHIIPKGFKTDLASIPRPIWSFMSPAHSALMAPSIVHDWFYRMTCDYDRKQIDLIFFHMLIAEGTPKWRAYLMYYAVRRFGAKSYNEDYCEKNT
jgi:hypothetical protein